MPKLAVSLRAKPGASEELKHVISLVSGPAAVSFEREMLGDGLTANTVWYEAQTETFVLVIEADDPMKAFERMEASDHPVAKWVRENVTRTTDFSPATMTPLELLYDWNVHTS